MRPAALLRFSIIRYRPDIQRQEAVNVGVVVFLPEGPRVTLAANQGKLLALDPNFKIGAVFAQGKRLQDALSDLWDSFGEVDAVLSHFHEGNFSLSATGVVDMTGSELGTVVEELLHDLVTPPAKRRLREPQTSRLHTELRDVFRRARILGSKPSDIAKHLVVPRYPIDPEVGLFAEFALRNGVLHVTETVDFRTSAPSIKKQEAQAKTLLLVQAMETIGATDLKRYVVVTGVTTTVQASMNLLQRHAEDLVVRESAEDWRRYVDAMHQAAKPQDADAFRH